MRFYRIVCNLTISYSGLNFDVTGVDVRYGGRGYGPDARHPYHFSFRHIQFSDVIRPLHDVPPGGASCWADVLLLRFFGPGPGVMLGRITDWIQGNGRLPASPPPAGRTPAPTAESSATPKAVDRSSPPRAPRGHSELLPQLTTRSGSKPRAVSEPAQAPEHAAVPAPAEERGSSTGGRNVARRIAASRRAWPGVCRPPPRRPLPHPYPVRVSAGARRPAPDRPARGISRPLRRRCRLPERPARFRSICWRACAAIPCRACPARRTIRTRQRCRRAHGPNTQDVEFFVMPVAQQIQQLAGQRLAAGIHRRESVSALCQEPAQRPGQSLPGAEHLSAGYARYRGVPGPSDTHGGAARLRHDSVLHVAQPIAAGVLVAGAQRRLSEHSDDECRAARGIRRTALPRRRPERDHAVVGGRHRAAGTAVRQYAENRARLARRPARQLADQRNQVQSAGASIRLDDLHGVESAKRWAGQLFNDLRLAMRGEIQWKEVDRGALFAGYPLAPARRRWRARSLSIAASPSRPWRRSGLDGGQRARRVRPADVGHFRRGASRRPASCSSMRSIRWATGRPSRGRECSWNTAFLNALLSELDGLTTGAR